MSRPSLSTDDGSLAQELAVAIKKRRIYMLYQPQICADYGSVGGVEALVRWQRRDGTFVSPDVFVPLAESCGLVNALTACVVERVLEDYRVLQASEIPVPMSINISARDLREGDFIPAFLHAADSRALEPTHFTFEITETAIVDDYDACIKNVGLLKSLGCRISLDDFGTGNASCSYVRSFPMDEVKIDRYFIKNVVNNDIDKIIVEFMINLGHRLGCDIVAEGVEDEATAGVLRRLGCDLMQGYRFSKPLTVYDLVGYINARHSESRS